MADYIAELETRFDNPTPLTSYTAIGATATYYAIIDTDMSYVINSERFYTFIATVKQVGQLFPEVSGHSQYDYNDVNVINYIPTLTATQGSPFSYQFTANSVNPLKWYNVDLSNITGLTLNETTGLLSGTPTAPIQSYIFTLIVSDNIDTYEVRKVKITIV